MKYNKRAKREIDQLEQLEREVRELKAINRSLTKQLKKLAKGINREEIEKTLNNIEETNKPQNETNEAECPNCGRNGLKELIIANRIFHRCSICDYKSGVIKNK